MKRILLSLLLLCCSGVAFAIVSLQLESPQVQMGENFVLTLKAEGSQINLSPDLTPLQKDFTIVGTESNVSYTLSNGRVNTVSEWKIELTPKQSGVFPIPAITIGQEKTKPINIEIRQLPGVREPNTTKPGAMQQQQRQQDVMLLADSNVSKPYINQQVIYTVRLYNASRLLNANYLPPQVEDALFVPFGDERRYQVNRNGRTYAVEEQQFALFPQKSGDLKIKPPVFSALVYDFTGPRRVSIQAESRVLKVQPIPAHYKNRNWLPAKQVTLSESYDKSTGALTEGSTLERTVTLQGVAVPAQLLPPLDFGRSDQFSIYPEKPTETTRFNQQDLVGAATVKVTYLLNKSGKVSIPPLSVPWFNTATGKDEVSSLPGFIIDVIPAASQNKQNNATVVAQSTPLPALSKEEQQSNDLIVTKPQANLAWWLAGLFALAWLLTMAAWRWQPFKRASSSQNKGQVLKQLQAACLSNNPRQARDALLKWGCLLWPEANLLNLIELANAVDEPALKQQIHQLSQVLYHDGANKEWQGQALWQCVANFKFSSAASKEKANTLPPIHRL